MDNQRLILLVVFCFSAFMLWEGWQKHEHPVLSTAATATSTTTASNAAVPTLSSIPATTGGVPITTATLGNVPKAVVKTDLFIADISAQGGDLIRLELIKHHATNQLDKNFVLFDNGEKHIYQGQSGLIGEGLPTHKSLWQLVPGNYELKDGQDSFALQLQAEGAGGIRVIKTYTFHRGSYLIDVDHEIINQGLTPVTPSVYFQITRDGKPPESASSGMMGMGATTFTGPAIYTEQDKYQKINFSDIDKGKDKHATKSDNGWVALVQHYFVSAWLPRDKLEREFFTRKVGDNLYSAGVILPVPTIAAGASTKLSVPLYAGPQEQDKLKNIAPGLSLVVDYGWLTVIAAPIFWVLEAIHRAVNNWGWSIILLTVMIKMIFFPLSAASYKSMAKMRLVTPKMAKLKETYGDDKMRLNQEMMELYKKEKINPLGGCLPILVQIPVFISLYWVLLGAVEMRNAPWLGWITDLSVKDPYYVLPLIMGATMLIQTKLNPTPPDPMQAKIMMIMPIVFTGMFLFFPSGLVLYWVVNNMLSIAQQWQITRMIEGGGKKIA